MYVHIRRLSAYAWRLRLANEFPYKDTRVGAVFSNQSPDFVIDNV